jgi:long-chain acyl-CoA synthetase
VQVTLLARFAAERPDEVALVDGERTMWWAEVDEALRRVTMLLRAAGLGPQQRLAVFAENSAETLLAHLGGLLAGVSTVPVNFHLTAEEVAHILVDSGTAVLVVGPETADRGREAAAMAGLPLVIDDWDAWLASAPDGEPPTDATPRPNLMYTSGTTGRPKGTELPPTMFAGGATVAEHVEALGGSGFVRFGTHLVAGPMYHTGPLSGFRLLAAGVPVVVLRRFDAEGVLAAIERWRTASSVMVPTHFVRLLALPEEVRACYDVSSMKLVAHTGAACPADVKRAMIEWWGPIFSEAYGATEVGTVASITSEEWLLHPGSVGRAAEPFEALVVDEAGRPVPAGTEGRLYFRDMTGRGIVYHQNPSGSAAAHLEPGVFTLGEIGYVDAEGYVHITDRFSDMVVSGGVNLYPAEAEQIMVQHSGVADVAVIGVPHPEMGEQLKALVVPVHPASPPGEGELLAFCRERLTSLKCPRSVELVETVGRTAMGKLDKRALRAPYWATERTIG